MVQSEIIGDEIDFILRFENLTEDFQTLCAKLNIKRDFPYFDAKPGRLGEKHQHYSRCFDEKMRDIIAYKHAVDIALFNYEFVYQNE